MEDGCKDWPAVKKWDNMQYLKNEFGLQSIQIHRLDREKPDPSIPFTLDSLVSRRNNFADFLNKTETQTEGNRYTYFIKNEMVVNKNLVNDYYKPPFFSKLLRNRASAITIWSDFRRKAEFKDRERYFCVING